LGVDMDKDASCKGMRKAGSFKGFTLVELMVAVMISAIGMVFVLSALQRTMAVLSTAEKMTTANYLLNRRIWENDQLDGESGPEEGETSGEFDEPYELFRWRRTVSEFPDIFGEESEPLKLHLWAETTTISWQGRGIARDLQTRNLTVTRFLNK